MNNKKEIHGQKIIKIIGKIKDYLLVQNLNGKIIVIKMLENHIGFLKIILIRKLHLLVGKMEML